MDLVRKVRAFIGMHRMIERGMTVVAAVSGGPDSMALLHVLNGLRKDLAISLHVAHLNHMFRGREAELDAEHVRAAADRYGLPVTVEKIDVPAYRKHFRLSAQDAARRVRYRFLSEVADRVKASRVALAHHADDQAETVLLHFIRGAGPAGMKGMEPVRDRYIRPFLPVRREEIMEYCRLQEVSYRVDSSNIKTVYARNRIRLRLLPLLEKEYNPGLVPALLRLADICREEDGFLNGVARIAFRNALLEEDAGRLVLSAGSVAGQPLALQRRIVRLAFGELTGGRDLSYRHVESALNVFKAENTGYEAVLPGGIRVRRSYDRVEVRAAQREGVPPFFRRLAVPGLTEIPEIGCRIAAAFLPPGAAPDPGSLSPAEALLDYELLPGGLYVRQRQPGDVFTPYGMDRSVKLKDFLIKQKVPREERDRLPVVAARQEIVWVGGVRPGERWKITPETKRILYLKIEKSSRGE